MRTIRRDQDTLLPGVMPVELPAPEASPPRSPSLAGRAFLSVALLAGLFVVAALVVIGLVGVNLLIFQTGRVVPALVVLALAVVLSMARGLIAMVRKPPEPEGEIEVPAHDEPELHERVRRLAEVVGTRPPDRVVVIPEVNAYVREFGPLMGLVRGTRTLAIGAPLLDVLTVSQLDAVLAHELGHLAGGDTRLGPLAFRTDQATMRMIASLRGKAIASVFVAYWSFQHRVSASVRRGQELVADRAAVTVAGRQVAADALHRVEIAGRAEALYREAYLIPLLETGCRPAELTSGLREILGDADRVAELSSDAAVVDDEVDPWATHPPTDQRIARVAALADPPQVAVDERPAASLWRDAERWSHAAHERWLELVADGQASFRTVGWDAFGEETAGRVQRAQAADVDRVLQGLGLTPGLDGLRQAITTGRGGALAGELIALGWRAPGADERESILKAAVMSTATREALDEHGGRFLFSWSEPLMVADSRGRPIPVGTLARDAVAGRWDPLQAMFAPRAGDRPQAVAAWRDRAGAQDRPVRPAAAAPPVDEQAIPDPPCPPFRPSSGDWLWELEMPGHMIGTKSRLAVNPQAVAFGQAVATYDQIQSVSFKLDASSGLQGQVKLGLASGKTLKLSSASISGEGKAAIEAAIQYLWVLFRLRVAPHLRSRIVAEIEAGGEAKVGNLTLSKAGIRHRSTTRTHQVPWDGVTDAVIHEGSVHILLASGGSIARPLFSENAFVLVDLVPELRARFG